MFGLGMPELLVILVLVLIFFGGKRLPQIGKGLGQSLREFKDITADASRSEVIDVEKAEESEDGTHSAAEPEEAAGSPAPSPSQSLREEIAQMPGVQEAKEVKETAAKVKKFTRILRKRV